VPRGDGFQAPFQLGILFVLAPLAGRYHPFALDPPRRREAHDLVDGGDRLEAPSVHLLLGEGPIDPFCQILGAELARLHH